MQECKTQLTRLALNMLEAFPAGYLVGGLSLSGFFDANREQNCIGPVRIARANPTLFEDCSRECEYERILVRDVRALPSPDSHSSA